MEKYIKELKKFKFTDTRVGTYSTYKYSNGNTLPYTGVPNAMNYFAAQTEDGEGSWWFNPESIRFKGFRLTHQPSPWMGDFSHILISPLKENLKYDISNSIFYPHYNQIYLQNNETFEVTGSIYDGIIKYNSSGNAGFRISAEKTLHLKQEGDKIIGYVINFAGCEDENLKMYIVISLDNEFTFLQKGDIYLIETQKSIVELKISTSFISIEQALLNHSRMFSDFEQMYENAEKSWNKYLDIFDVDNTLEESNYDKFNKYDRFAQERMFYHCVYRSFLFPMRFYELNANNEEIHYDTISKSVKKGKLFTNVGFWDLNKTLFPLFSLVAVELYEDILEGILNFYKDTGYLPKWQSPDERGLMPGTLVDNVIADASSKGIGLNKMEEFLDAMINSSKSKSEKYGRFSSDSYEKYGYIPSDMHESVNQTLDNVLSDFSIGIVAKNLGKMELSQKYFELSKNYKKIFNKEYGLMVAKDREGNFVNDYDPLNWGSPYTEGSAYQNSFNVYHDIGGLRNLFESFEKFDDMMIELANKKSEFLQGSYGFEIHEMTEFASSNFGQIAISNQPSFHLPYIYAFTEYPEYTSLIVKELLLNYFNYDMKGYPGDEDNGSMSSWYIFSSLGIYPFCPGTNQYIIGIPFWNNAKIRLSNGNILEIITNENYHHKKFINNLKIDGEDFNKLYIKHEDLIRKNKMEYTLGILPNNYFDKKDRPYSLSETK